MDQHIKDQHAQMQKMQQQMQQQQQAAQQAVQQAAQQQQSAAGAGGADPKELEKVRGELQAACTERTASSSSWSSWSQSWRRAR